MTLIHFKSYKPLKLEKNGILEKIRVIVYVFLAPGSRIHNSWFVAGMHNFYVFLPPGRTIFTCFSRRELGLCPVRSVITECGMVA